MLGVDWMWHTYVIVHGTIGHNAVRVYVGENINLNVFKSLWIETCQERFKQLLCIKLKISIFGCRLKCKCMFWQGQVMLDFLEDSHVWRYVQKWYINYLAKCIRFVTYWTNTQTFLYTVLLLTFHSTSEKQQQHLDSMFPTDSMQILKLKCPKS